MYKKEGWNPFFFSTDKDGTIPPEVLKSYQIYKLRTLNLQEEFTTDLSNLTLDPKTAITKLKNNRHSTDFKGFIRPDFYQQVDFKHLFPRGHGLFYSRRTVDLDL